MREFLIRFRTILIAVVFILIITGFFVFPSIVIDIAEQLQDKEGNARVMLALAAVLIDLVLVFVIYQEIRFKSSTLQGLVVRSRTADAEVTLDSVATNLDMQIAKLDDIFAVKSNIRADRGRVAIQIDIDADDHINVRNKTADIHREIVKIVDKQMGLKLGPKPVIKFRLMSEPAAVIPEDDDEKKKGRLASLFSREKKPEEDFMPIQEAIAEKPEIKAEAEEPLVIPLPAPPTETKDPTAYIIPSEPPEESEN